MDLPIHIHHTNSTPEVIIQKQENKVYFNFKNTHLDMDLNYLSFFNPILDFIESTAQSTKKPLKVYFDKSLVALRSYDYTQKLLGELEILSHQGYVELIFVE